MVGLHRSAGRVTGIPRRTAAVLVAAVALLLLLAAFCAPAAPAGVQPVTTVATAQGAQELGALRYGAESQQVLELLLPDASSFSGPYPVVVYLHSGGWIGGDRTALNDIAAEQLHRGYAVASVDYRLATTSLTGTPVASFPGAVWDVKTAIRYLKVSSRSLDIDPHRVVLMGSSAGGHLAAFVGATAGRFEPPHLPRSLRKVDSTVAAVVDLVGPTDLATFEHTPHPWATSLTAAFLGCPVPTIAAPYTCDDSLLRTASVATYLDPSDPPIYLAYGAQDSLVVPATQGAPLAGAWVQAHCGNTAVASYHVVDDGHDLSPADVDATLDPWLDTHAGPRGVQYVTGSPAARTCRRASLDAAGIGGSAGHPGA
jgi:acetyl esterase/lipase